MTHRLVAVPLLTILLTSTATPALSDEVLKIGVLAPLTGAAAQWGLGLDGGVRIAAGEVNERGGLSIAGRKYRLEVVSYDDGYKAASAVIAANRLIDQDGVRIIFGPIPSTSLLAIKPITEERKVLLFTSAWSAKTFENTRYVFRIGPTTQEFVPLALQWLKSARPEVKKVATLAANDETGWNSQRVQKAAYGAAGYEISSAELFERTQTDFRALLTKVLSTRPDSIELDTVPPATAGLIVRQARELGYKGGFTKFGGYDIAEIVKGAGVQNAEGVVGTLFADTASASWDRLKKAYAGHHKGEMGDYVVLYYDIARLAFDALEKAGSPDDTEAIRQAIERNSPYDGIEGRISWGGQENYGVNHQLLRPIFLTGIEGGKPALVKKLDSQ